MNRIPVIAGNWKMNLDHQAAARFFQQLCEALKKNAINLKTAQVIVFPPFTDLCSVQKIATEHTAAPYYGGQDLSPDIEGAFTGDISGSFLKKLGCEYVLVGHSERRMIHHETDQKCLAKVMAALKSGLTAILCVGEPLEERDAKNHVTFTLRQVKAVVGKLSSHELEKVIIAYEPVWAIGTGKVATTENAQEMAAAIRKSISEVHTQEVADNMRILYGGSVKGHNAAEIITQHDIDGALVGGASLDIAEFMKIIDSVHA